MKHLKKAIVKKVIDLAMACPRDRNFFTPEEIREAVKNNKTPEIAPQVREYNVFIKSLASDELAELTVLYWLGRDKTKDPNQWDVFVAELKRTPREDMIQAPKQDIPQRLRLGMERLARATKQKKMAEDPASGRILVKTKEPESPIRLVNPEIERKRLAIIGRYALEAFQERYGKDTGLKRLITLLDGKGYLDLAADRELFGLSAKDPEDDLVAVLESKNDD